MIDRHSAPPAAQMFLTEDALFILVVDMYAYTEDRNSRENALEQWLDILQSRVPGSVVLAVGTHGDSFDSAAERSKRVKCFLKGEWVVREVRRRFHPIAAIIVNFASFS